MTVLNKWIRWDKRFKHCFPHNLRSSWDYQTWNLTGGHESYQLLIYSGLCLRACISNYNLSALESQGADEDHSRTRASPCKRFHSVWTLKCTTKRKECSVLFSHGSTIYLHFCPALHVHTIVTQIAWYCKQWVNILWDFLGHNPIEFSSQVQSWLFFVL